MKSDAQEPLVFEPDAKVVGLFVTHRGQKCGVWQFGARLYRALAVDGSIAWHYLECGDLHELQKTAAAIKPDIILANYHPFTMPWAAKGLEVDGAVSFSVFHEASRESIAALEERPFDFLLCPDPTLLPIDLGALPVPRFIPALVQKLPPVPSVFTVGSFGFGTPGKGFDSLCAMVNAQCDEARIRINIPPHDNEAMVSSEQVSRIVDACQAAVTRPGITLDITHNFFDEAELLDFLAANTINAFLYDDAPGRGISSCTDYALAAGRPIAVTRTSMFRHLSGINPSICVEDRPLSAIAASGTHTLKRYRATYAETAAGAAWNSSILNALARWRVARSLPDGRGFNKLLDDRSRAAYSEALEELHRLAPDMLARKIERANIQQAFALDAVQRLAERYDAPRILAIGSFEDTTVASLKALGYRLDEADPQVDGRDLESFYHDPSARSAFDIVLCVSVLEHVADDETFVRQAAALLAPGGIAVFTVDYSDRYPETGLRPAADQRLYTRHDLRSRLMGVLPDCALVDTPNWSDGEDDFEYEGCRYAFATWVFTRLPAKMARHADLLERGLGGPPWKALLASVKRHVVTLDAANTALEDALASEKRRFAKLQDELDVELRRVQRLRMDLRMDDGPRALRAVLPLARAIRSSTTLARWSLPLTAKQLPAMPTTEASTLTPLLSTGSVDAELQNSIQEQSDRAGHGDRSDAQFSTSGIEATPSTGRKLAKGLLRPVYRKVVVPVVRPIMWRIRSFMLRPVADQVADVRHDLAALQAASIRDQDPMSAEFLKSVEALLLTISMRAARIEHFRSDGDIMDPSRPERPQAGATSQPD